MNPALRGGEGALRRGAPSLGWALLRPWSALYLKSTERRLNGSGHRQCALPGGREGAARAASRLIRAKGGAGGGGTPPCPENVTRRFLDVNVNLLECGGGRRHLLQQEETA